MSQRAAIRTSICLTENAKLATPFVTNARIFKPVSTADKLGQTYWLPTSLAEQNVLQDTGSTRTSSVSNAQRDVLTVIQPTSMGLRHLASV